MKKKIFYYIAILLLANGSVSAQCSNSQLPDQVNCINSGQLYTSTTDPNDNSAYNYVQNTFNFNLNPNGLNGPTHFNWMTQKDFTVYTIPSTTSGVIFHSPFYPIGLSPVNGGSGNSNIESYEQTSASLSLSDYQKLKAMDVLASDGWELLKYDFGSPANPKSPPSLEGLGVTLNNTNTNA
ncbi:MAG: hypothetical protein JSU07_06290 [Bacteroidetes bacterium]|nr:hypothetical protein [Bacteroidota bacterium]